MNWAGSELRHFKDHYTESRLFMQRAVISLLAVFILLCVLLARFYSLQVVHYEDYVTQSDRNRIHTRPVPPNRGLIYDRNGELLAENRPSFTLSIVRERVTDLDATIDHLSRLISISETDIDNFYKLLKQRRRPFESIPLRYRLTEQEISIIAVNEFALQGVEVEAQLVRYYPGSSLYAHTVGYVSRINERELSEFDEQTYKLYAGTHSIGKIGLERYYELDLLGSAGQENVEANAHGRVLRSLERTDPLPGKDLHLFLDSRLQQTAVDALGGRRGAVVAIEIETGGVLTLVSQPSYDPNLFVTGISVADYNALNHSVALPLYNRAIQAQYPPGSTIKPVLGLAGLASHVVNYETRIRDPGFYRLENDDRLYRDWKKYGHGNSVDLRQAIVESCDTFFYGMAFQMGVDRMHEFGSRFGLGLRTGLDIPSERPGLWPSREWKRGAQGLPWFPGDNLNMSIGQGFVLTTPLQLAMMSATLATRGKLIRPRLVERIGDELTETEVVSQFEGQADHWNYVLEAMEGVVHDVRGTAHRSMGTGISYRAAGKTGTAQVVGIAQDAEYESEKLRETNRDHALFIGFAPANEPKIAVAVIVENGEQSSEAAKITRKMFDTFMALYPNSPAGAKP